MPACLSGRDVLLSGGTRRSLDVDQFLDACDRVFEGQPSPPAPPAVTLTDEFEMLAQGSVSVSHAAARFEGRRFVLTRGAGRLVAGRGGLQRLRELGCADHVRAVR